MNFNFITVGTSGLDADRLSYFSSLDANQRQQLESRAKHVEQSSLLRRWLYLEAERKKLSIEFGGKEI